ncbi:unnamed protein product [Thelazia callipaeda]|uniref:Ion_trans domain-containing protein n=1 Tax=Thelazia callipaeda TaxID=103827 RepID=A0A0N5D7R7_THECL|nr:unnamed protein product [Thelazia callipaeda]
MQLGNEFGVNEIHGSQILGVAVNKEVHALYLPALEIFEKRAAQRYKLSWPDLLYTFMQSVLLQCGRMKWLDFGFHPPLYETTSKYEYMFVIAISSTTLAFMALMINACTYGYIILKVRNCPVAHFFLNFFNENKINASNKCLSQIHFWYGFSLPLQVHRRFLSYREKTKLAEQSLSQRRFADDLMGKMSKAANFDFASNQREINTLTYVKDS